MEPRNIHGKRSQRKVEKSRGQMSSIDKACPGSLEEAFQARIVLASLMERVAFKVNFWIGKENKREYLGMEEGMNNDRNRKDTRWGRWSEGDGREEGDQEDSRDSQWRASHREMPGSGSGPHLPGQDPQTRRLALPY